MDQGGERKSIFRQFGNGYDDGVWGLPAGVPGQNAQGVCVRHWDNLMEAEIMDGEEKSENKTEKTKKAGSAKAGSSATRMIAVKEIKTHPAFENLLRIDEEDQGRLTRKMGDEGFYESEVWCWRAGRAWKTVR